LSYSDLYKPPSNDEIIHLRGTENMFSSNSNLVKLQFKETLNEISITKKQRSIIDDYLHSVHDVIMKIPSKGQALLQDHSCLGDIKFPMVENPRTVKGNMIFLPPVEIKVVGSYQLNTGIKQHLDVDLLLIMPKECMQEKDHLNQRYLRKRAAYLYVASYLHANDYDVKFGYFHQETLKPILVVTPTGKLEKVVIRLHVCPEAGSLKVGRFAPGKSNVRFNWFYGKQGEGNFPSTPHYNHLVLMDLYMESNLQTLHNTSKDFPEFKNSIKLIKTWLYQRELNQGCGSFSGFIASMLLHYLLNIGKINKVMSCLQIVKNFFQFLATSDWKVQGIGCSDEQVLKDFHENYEVVFTDENGKLNFCGSLTAIFYDQVRHEAKISLSALSASGNAFDVIFLSPAPFTRKYDYIINVYKPKLLKQSSAANEHRLVDMGGYYIGALTSTIADILIRGFGHRVELCGVCTPSYGLWNIGEKPPNWYQVSNHLSGLILNEDHAFNPLQLGPSADSIEAKSFREFWGNLSDLRRFKDGSICESVVFGSDDLVGLREIPIQIAKHILFKHCDIPLSALSFSTNQIEEIISLPWKQLSSGNYVVSMAIRSYNEICHKIRELHSLPLSITSIQGGPILRNTEVYPTPPFQTTRIENTIEIAGVKREIPVPGQPCAPFRKPIEIVCHLEGSGAWPQEAGALRRLKAAFHVSMCEALKSSFTCVACQDHFDVIKDGFVFRISVAYHREVAVMQTQRTDDGMIKMVNTAESIELEKRILKLPQLASALHGLHQRFGSYGRCCRVTKRWINSMMLSGQLRDEAVDLLCAFIYLSPQPYLPPGSSQVGFLRFLHFISTFDFNSTPLVVDFNNELTESDMNDVHDNFNSNRSTLPPICIFTSKDRLQSPWTTSGPSKIILRRMKDLARITLRSIETKIKDAGKDMGFKNILSHSLSAYDVIIRLKSEWLPRRYESEEYKQSKRNTADYRNVCNDCLPVLNFDPLRQYFDDLKNSFHELAIFFYDCNGGSVIGVLWKPNAFKPKPFQLLSSCCVLQPDGKVVPEVSMILEDFKIMGQGLVDSITLNSDKWKI
uniref:Nucleolar protein 6 n=1 Tax=Ciona savignyi TaxID=51511 RepID=H2YJS5_CIOSA